MERNIDINVHHLSRVEGHGNIVVDMKNGELKKARLEIVEAPRFFEAFMRGRHFSEAAIISSRICGICSLGHQLTSLKATEAALGIPVSRQTEILRSILVDAATFQSNILHSLFLVTPDLLNLPSVFPLMGINKPAVEAALRLKRLANRIGEVLSGRAVHPVRCIPGGFSKLPEVGECAELRDAIRGKGREDLNFIAELLKTLVVNIPEFTRETEYISLGSRTEYPLYDGYIFSSDSGAHKAEDYQTVADEFVVEHSSSKHARHLRSSYMVGALSRFNNNHEKLLPSASALAEELGLAAPCHNPFMNTVAQIVETQHCMEHAADLLDQLAEEGLQKEVPEPKISRYGRGIGITEVPRGILFHDYTYGRNGVIEKANCVIPTGQNLANIDDDMKKLVPEIADRSDEEITRQLEMLVRAYDPCISCSVHSIKVSLRR